MTVEDAWAKEIIERIDNDPLGIAQQGNKSRPPSGKNMVRKWAMEKWEKSWKHHLDTVSRSKRTPAHNEVFGHQRDKLHQGLRKAESSLAIQLRTEKIGFAAFLHARKVPHIISLACQCGWRRQNPKHVIVFCLDCARNHQDCTKRRERIDIMKLCRREKGSGRWLDGS